MTQLEISKAKRNGKASEVVDGEPADTGESDVVRGIRQVREGFEGMLGQKAEERAATLRRQAEEIAAIHARHKEELQPLDDDIGHLQNVLAALNGKAAPSLKSLAQPKPKRSTASKRVGVTTRSGTATGFGVSLEVAEEAVKTMRKLIAKKEKAGEPPFFTQKEFYRSLDWDQSKGSQAIRFLRNIEFLRKAGKSPDGRADLWAILDDGAFEREKAKAEERTEQYERGAFADGDQPPRDRIIAALTEMHRVEGQDNLADICDIPRGAMRGLLAVLAEENVINIIKPPTQGKKTIIELGEAA